MAQKVWVYDKTAATWRNLSNQPKVYDTAGGANIWRSVKKMWVAKHYIPTGQTDYITEWHFIGDWTTPTTAPFSCAIQKHSPTDNTRPLVSWGVVTDSSDDRYNYNMVVNIYINGVLAETSIVAQSAGSVLAGNTYNQFDSAYADLWYQNPNNGATSPTTETSTIILGP